MSRLNAPRTVPICLLLALALVLVACAGPAPSPASGPQAPLAPTVKPGGGPQAPLSSTLMTPPPAGLSATMAGTPGKPGIATTMVQPPAATPGAAPVSFSKNILPLLRQRCALCHIDQSMGGLSLKDYNSLMKGGQSGLEVVIGSPETSLLWRKLVGDPAVGEGMPKGGPYLPGEAINKVSDWIRQGAPNN